MTLKRECLFKQGEVLITAMPYHKCHFDVIAPRFVDEVQSGGDGGEILPLLTQQDSSPSERLGRAGTDALRCTSSPPDLLASASE
jgi:hypothetical protein